MKEYTVGQELTFDIYGNELRGEYIRRDEVIESLIWVKVLYDETNVSHVGEDEAIHESYLAGQ